MTMMILRRRKLGLGSAKGMSAFSEGAIDFVRNDKMHTKDWSDVDTIIRWGCTSETGQYGVGRTIINNSQAIHKVNNKRSFAKEFGDAGWGPKCWTDAISWDVATQADADRPFILRPGKHAQGKNVHLLPTGPDGLDEAFRLSQRYQGDIYIRPFIDKVAEYRVYVMCGKVVTVAKKTPADPTAIAWNVAQGGRFDVVRFGEWPLEACRVALGAFAMSGLHFSGVDVMVEAPRSGEDAEGKAYVIELNSAPSLPALSDGSISYRQKVMAKGFMWHGQNGWDFFSDVPEQPQHWRDVIHPGTLQED